LNHREHCNSLAGTKKGLCLIGTGLLGKNGRGGPSCASLTIDFTGAAVVEFAA